jgi:hypothetical protein
VLAVASSVKDLWRFWPEPSFKDIAFLHSRGGDHDARQHPAAGRLPACLSAKNAPTARSGAVIGGASYILFAFVPMFHRRRPRWS